MDTIKSPRFWLALAGMAATVALTLTGHVKGETAIGVIVGVMGGFGVATIPGSVAKTKGPMMLTFSLVMITAAIFSGCATAGQYDRGMATARAAERTACVAGLLACDFAKEEHKEITCKAARKACEVFPKLLEAWGPVFKPASKPVGLRSPETRPATFSRRGVLPYRLAWRGGP